MARLLHRVQHLRRDRGPGRGRCDAATTASCAVRKAASKISRSSFATRSGSLCGVK
ncbi:hypothetical protein ACFQY5_21085 [Paeniroseomonas aquatica]|uniref:hypothetical protein n=1 Tax=Paeniroseomonas aquatica TaxID=373043 RepID=UPI003613B9D2